MFHNNEGKEDRWFHQDGEAFGILLVMQRTATVTKSLTLASAAVICWGTLLFLRTTGLYQALPDISEPLLGVVGFLFLFAIWLSQYKSIRCYEKAVVVTGLRSARKVFIKDIVGVGFLAKQVYSNGILEIFQSTLEVIPYTERSFTIRLIGSRADSLRIQRIVETILKSNPKARLLDWD
jgi:hypothetical protein